MWKYMVLVATHLSWMFNFLLQYHCFSFSKSYDHELDLPAETTETLSIVQYKTKPGTSSSVECAVCLCKIEEGEEITELRCAHLFHRVCLSRWAGVIRHATCPLCRSCVAPPMSTETQVLVFRFCSFGSDGDDRDTWWLR